MPADLTAVTGKPGMDDFQKRVHPTLLGYNVIEDDAQKRIIKGWIHHADSCLELGGGAGRITHFLEPYFNNVAMIDLADNSLQLARTKLKKTTLVRADISNVPMKDSSFDFIVMVKVVHLLPDPALAMREIQRVSRNHGILIMSFPNLQTNHLIRNFEDRVSPKLRHVFPTFGPAVWPLGYRPYPRPHELIVTEAFRLKGRRGTGLFDNYFGKVLSRFRFLHLIDVATSPLWFSKLEVFFKFEIIKESV